MPFPKRLLAEDEEVAAVEVICSLVAAELVNDGDTIQMGVGTVSAALGLYLGDKNDLGVQTELITGGIVDLVEHGVVTGNRKTIHPRKVVGSALTALPRDEMDRIDGNPIFELYDFGHTDDLRRLIALTAGGGVGLRIRTYPLDAFADAVADLENGRMHGRGVLVPGGP